MIFPNEVLSKSLYFALAGALSATVACGGGAGSSETESAGPGGTEDTAGVDKPGSGIDAGRTADGGASNPNGGADAGPGWVDAGTQEWSCLENTTWARADSTEISYTGKAVSALGGEALGGVEFEVCPEADDPSCSNPVLEGRTGADGTYTGMIPAGSDGSGFDGYARVTGGEDVVDSILFFNPPITENRDAPDAAPLVTREVFETFVEVGMGETPDADRGHLALEALDCTWSRAGGVAFEIDAADGETVEAYLRGGTTPVASAEKTDGTGLGGFVNVPPGEVTVTARVAETDAYIGEVDIFVEAATVSEVAVAPIPAARAE